MSTSIKVSWKCTCKPSTTTGWIDGDTENIYCNNCDGVITTLDKLKMTDIKRLDNIQKVIDADTYGEDMDYLDIEREVGEIRQVQADELSDV
mgnify:FL=1